MNDHAHTAPITAVTGFYDVGRASLDGRTPEKYIAWLNKSLKLPLPFLVFLDPEFDASGIILKPQDKIIRVAKNDLTMFGHREAVEGILANRETVNKRDITFNLAEYGMIVMSKPELLKRAARETGSPTLVWIDAGHCRFIEDLQEPQINIDPSEFDGISLGINITHFLAQRLRLKKFPKQLVGKCLAMMSAEDFMVSRDFAEEFSDRIDFMVETEWLPNGLWDNEQVAIGCLLLRGGLPGTRILETLVSGSGNTARWLFGGPIVYNPMPFYVGWRIFLDEFRTRLVPKNECFIAGDFPEASFQKFVKQRSAK